MFDCWKRCTNAKIIQNFPIFKRNIVICPQQHPFVFEIDVLEIFHNISLKCKNQSVKLQFKIKNRPMLKIFF